MGRLRPETLAVFEPSTTAPNTVDAATAEFLLNTLNARPVRPEDLETLVAMRRECGWGEERLLRDWTNPDRRVFVFVAKDGEEEREVGMGMLILEGEQMASRANRTVMISSLYVRHKYRHVGLGSRGFKLLEDMARDEFGADWLTLDTGAHQIHLNEDKTGIVEDQGSVSSRRKIYEGKGYEIVGDPYPRYEPDLQMAIHFIDMKKATAPAEPQGMAS